MERMKSILKKIKVFLSIKWHFLNEALEFYKKLNAHNASVDTDKCKLKMQYSLLRENHVIEKGMSLKNPKRNFGKQKVTALLKRLKKYHNLYEDNDFMSYPLSTIEKYISYMKEKNDEVNKIEIEFNKLVSKSNGFRLDLDAGTQIISKKDIWKKAKIDFESFVKSRHSIRYFTDECPSIEIIRKGLQIAQYTPSACNRQSWSTYIFTGEMNNKLIKWQNGANGFENEIKMSLLVTSNMNAFLSYEPYQTHVDGGLYAMSLIYALHSLGLGIIPLSTGFYKNKIELLHKNFNIPKNEVPIMILGVGCLLDRFRVAISKRKNINTVIKLINKKENYK